MGNFNINWHAIRALNGSQSGGFEELCAQLARAETPVGAEFERKGAPDGGVECYATLSDRTEWGWQAKYFHVLGRSQWPQLDESIKTALEKHPRLVRYYVCVPVDRSDARAARQRSVKDHWDAHVQKWEGWASRRQMSVEFVYWGSHELVERLQRPGHVGRVRFWFDVHRFDQAWFTKRLEEAIKAAGPRYTPEIHVDLPVAAEFEAFGRTDRLFDTLAGHAPKIREKVSSFGNADANTTDPLGNAVSALLSGLQAVLTEIGAVRRQAIEVLPFSNIARLLVEAETAANRVEEGLVDREREHDAKPSEPDPDGSHASRSRNPFRDRRVSLGYLSDELRKAHEAFKHAAEIANRTLMLLSGDAGSGKTHLLCDVLKARIDAGRPTVLLMGQRFQSREEPWAQALQHLDLGGLSAEEFVGALDAAAQAANCRAFVMIDALNEGAGRIIWPSHLAPFLVHLERSPWIAVVLSVRASYEKILLPAEVLARAKRVTHQGFAEHEYDAMRTFFTHYGIELPSTPLLDPEFRNPLFLKTVCSGLQRRGEHRFPRGSLGITAVFEMYLGAINDSLARAFGFDPKAHLVRRALEAISAALIDSEERSLTVSKAKDVVNALLPGRAFDKSLYHALVVEGVLVEEGEGQMNTVREEIVFVAYERLADHLATKTLLDRHLGTGDPALAFSPGHSLAFMCDQYSVTPGLLEAMCIQIPERTGRELISLVPHIADSWDIADAFRKSIVWRAISAFSQETVQVLNSLVRSVPDRDATLEVILTVATFPGHPLNADYLDKRLRNYTMPERDERWSVYLHRAWGGRGAVDRLVDWGSSVSPSSAIDDETLDLCATSLAWMFTTSNRFVRDRATKALVSLLTGRLPAVARLVDRFAGVDDPYVVERVYAVAYGISMRSHDRVGIGMLAMRVYARVFEGGRPPRRYCFGTMHVVSSSAGSVSIRRSTSFRIAFGHPIPRPGRTSLRRTT